MTIRIISVGKRHSATLADAIEEYTTRLSAYAKPEWVLVPPVHSDSRDQQVNYESTALLGKIKPDEYVILLDETGRQFTNPEFVQRIEAVLNQGTSTITFIIGGAYGVNQVVKERANLVWSLSPLVFPHQLVRLLLAEQLYRSFSLRAGHPYHHL